MDVNKFQKTGGGYHVTPELQCRAAVVSAAVVCSSVFRLNKKSMKDIQKARCQAKVARLKRERGSNEGK